MPISKIVKRAAAMLSIGPFWLWAGAKMTLDWIARSTIPENVGKEQDVLGRSTDWLLSTPWWVPALLASALTVVLALLLFPRHERRSANQVLTPDSDACSLPTESSDTHEVCAVLERFIRSIFVPAYQQLSRLLVDVYNQQIRRAYDREICFYKLLSGSVCMPARDEAALYEQISSDYRMKGAMDLEEMYELFARLYYSYIPMKNSLYLCCEFSRISLAKDEAFRRWMESDENLAVNIERVPGYPALIIPS